MSCPLFPHKLLFSPRNTISFQYPVSKSFSTTDNGLWLIHTLTLQYTYPHKEKFFWRLESNRTRIKRLKISNDLAVICRTVSCLLAVDVFGLKKFCDTKGFCRVHLFYILSYISWTTIPQSLLRFASTALN